MKIIRNNILPFKGFSAINLAGVLFVRGARPLSKTTINHERIHTEQWKELLYVGFALWYLTEWTIRLFAFKGAHHAYKNISLEREAYANQAEAGYSITRDRFAFTRYIRKKKK